MSNRKPQEKITMPRTGVPSVIGAADNVTLPSQAQKIEPTRIREGWKFSAWSCPRAPFLVFVVLIYCAAAVLHPLNHLRPHDSWGVQNWSAFGLLYPLSSLVGARVATLLFWEVPALMLCKRYDVVPRRQGFAFLFVGLGGILIGGASVIVQALTLQLPLVFGVSFLVFIAGFVCVCQGGGVLIFRSRAVGMIVGVYVLLAFVGYRVAHFVGTS